LLLSWSAATFAALDRAKLSNKLKAKRERGAIEEDIKKISSFGKKIGRKKRYQQVCLPHLPSLSHPH
jgi:hypothetical protein